MAMIRINPRRILSLVICALSLFMCEANEDDSSGENRSVRLTKKQNLRKLRRPDHPCILVRVEVDFDLNQQNREPENLIEFGGIRKDEDEVRCELIDDDIAKANGQYFVPIIGLETESLDIESGVTTLKAEGAVFDGGALRVPQGAAIEMGSIDDLIDNENDSPSRRMLQSRQKNRRLAMTGKRKVLVVRADARDQKTSINSSTLSNNIFGLGGDSVTLVSQYDACSHGKLTFEPYMGNGVVEVNIDEYVNGNNKFDVQNAMMDAVTKKYGDLYGKVDHLMFCLPPGTGEWIAYAYVNSWVAVFNDDWCQQLSTQVHEIGHNLGLSHSGRNGDDYGDRSGMMGYSFKDDNGPLQCFNPAKSYQLGWYGNSVVEWNPITQGTWVGYIEGVTHYKKKSNSQTIIVKINRSYNTNKDLYIGYNRKTGINRGVMDAGDQITIIEAATEYSASNLIGGLDPTVVSSKTFNNFENSKRNLIIDFIEYDGSKDKAFVAIYMDNCRYPACCQGEMCNVAPFQDEEEDEEEKDNEKKDDPLPLLVEILPNPSDNQELYVEIYNPTSSEINLRNYRICVQNGRKGNKSCEDLKRFTLEPGEYYMLCRNKDSLPASRVCHQEDSKFRIRNGKKQKITLVRENNKNVEIIADSVNVPKPKKYEGKAYKRGNQGWDWGKPTE